MVRPCVVLSSEVKRHPGDDADTFSVAIRFRYTFRGRAYESGRYDFEPGSSSGSDAKQEIVDRLPAGSETTCWVNPERPSEAVIDREAGSWAWFALFPLPFLAVGTGGIWWVIRARRKEARDRAAREAASRGAAPRVDAIPGPLRLKPRQGPVVRAAGTGFVALFWNGVVAVFAGFAVKGWLDGDGSWVLTLFLVPFLLVGAGLLWAFGKSLRGLASPRPVLTLEPGSVPVGGGARLSWAFEGRAPSLSLLRVTLEGSEEASYSRGTDRVTDRSLFHRSDVVLTGDPLQAVAGSADVAPPGGAVPSLEAPSNRVVWLLRVVGERPGAPRIEEEFEIDVVPPPPGSWSLSR